MIGTFTRDQIKRKVEEEWQYMPEEEKHQRLINGDPTFLEYVYGSMKLNDTVILDDEDSYYYEIKRA